MNGFQLLCKQLLNNSLARPQQKMWYGRVVSRKSGAEVLIMACFAVWNFRFGLKVFRIWQTRLLSAAVILIAIGVVFFKGKKWRRRPGVGKIWL